MNESRQPQTGSAQTDPEGAGWHVLTRWFSLIRQILLPDRWPSAMAYMSRLALALVGLPVMALVQLINALGLVCDNCLFRQYRKVRVTRAVFILGVPRSGTTHTHHLLSADPRFTTVALWEALFAPSITQRYLLSSLWRVDRALGGLMARLLQRVEGRLQGALEDVHPTGLGSPEEDFLLLMPWLDCFLLVLAFPDSRWLWQLARGDETGQRANSACVMRRYHALLQRHLYFHGTDRQLLSKNASFAGLSRTLAAEFPDSLIIVCERDARMAARSQLRSLADVRRVLHVDRLCPDFDERLMALLEFYYRNLDRLQDELPGHRCVRLPLWQLSREPRTAMTAVYRQLSLGRPDALESTFRALESRAPTRPGTRDCARDADGGAAGRFDRFRPWCHAPENRL